jgi:hypothetical protein
MSRSQFPSADARPRIHIWPGGRGYRFSIGATGRSTQPPAATVGGAVDAALAHIQAGEAVIILEGDPT